MPDTEKAESNIVQEQPVTPTIIPDQEPAEPSDVDEIELRDALNAANAEKAAENATDQPSTKPEGDKPGEPPKPDHVMIPKAAFDERLGKERERTAEAERAAAYWKGIADARNQAAPAAQQQQPAQYTPEQKLVAIGAAIDELAKKFDDGEITMADFKKEERRLSDLGHGIREEAWLAKVPRSAPPSEALYLDSVTAELETSHPWVIVADQVAEFEKAQGSPGRGVADWNYVKNLAIDSCLARGIDPTKGDLGSFQLRKEMAELWDELGPSLVGARAAKYGISLPVQQQQQQQQPTGPRGLSAEAQARKAALAKSSNAPPNLAAMAGNAGDGSGVPSDASIEAMDEDTIGNLPDSVRRKLLGVT